MLATLALLFGLALGPVCLAPNRNIEKKTDMSIAKEKNVGVIYFSGPIDTFTVNLLIDAFIESIKHNHKAVIFEINSHGGTVDDGARFAKFIEQFPLPVHCIADQMAHSIAFYIFQSCDRRVMTKRAELLIHAPSVGVIKGTIAEHEDDLRTLKSLNQGMTEHEARKMKISVEELRRRIYHRDWRLGWEEALEVGAVDEVVDTSLNYLKSL
jgi:ATP-dependent protease ClpP protease subunit